MPASKRLTKMDKRVLRMASGEAVSDVLVTLEPQFEQGRWLNKSNRYQSRVVELIRVHTTQARPGRRAHGTIHHRDLARYIASSAALHAVDGWCYLGRGLDALAKGDAGACRHLAYYAELRAAMALLASEGIGVFNKRNFIVKSISECELIPTVSEGTHVFSWLALNHWSDQPRSGLLVSEIVGTQNVSLGDWMQAFGAPLGSPIIASSWLKQWGIDLWKLSRDRDARNESSYRPCVQGFPASIGGVSTSEALRTIWQSCAPIDGTRFLSIDKYLIRVSLQIAFRGITGKTPLEAPAQFASRVEQMLDSLNFQGAERARWAAFFTRASDGFDPSILVNASGGTDPDDPSHHLYVIARAGLLLRIASGACARRLAAAGLAKDNLEFWWKSFGEDRGLWDLESEPEQISDLWDDSKVAIEALQKWEEDSKSGINDGTLATLLRERADAITVLGQCERVALWSLGL